MTSLPLHHHRAKAGGTFQATKLNKSILVRIRLSTVWSPTAGPIVGLAHRDRSCKTWKYAGIGFKYISCGALGCWGIGFSNSIYFRNEVCRENCEVCRENWSILRLVQMAMSAELRAKGANVCRRVEWLQRRPLVAAGRWYLRVRLMYPQERMGSICWWMVIELVGITCGLLSRVSRRWWALDHGRDMYNCAPAS